MQNVINEAFLKRCMMPFFTTDDKNVHIENITKNLAPLVTHLASKTHLLGDNLTMVDFQFFEMVEYAIKLTDNAVFTTYPTL